MKRSTVTCRVKRVENFLDPQQSVGWQWFKAVQQWLFEALRMRHKGYLSPSKESLKLWRHVFTIVTRIMADPAQCSGDLDQVSGALKSRTFSRDNQKILIRENRKCRSENPAIRSRDAYMIWTMAKAAHRTWTKVDNALEWPGVSTSPWYPSITRTMDVKLRQRFSC